MALRAQATNIKYNEQRIIPIILVLTESKDKCTTINLWSLNDIEQLKLRGKNVEFRVVEGLLVLVLRLRLGAASQTPG
jgi:hypothetical protein